ncbi:MAG TPA: HAMP domain-containing sensor histidine kinase [Verrucomicrobiales bacterium]|jgi:signal transduction histidine kinase|nr:HAMP domain-containing sensor histidine kinase [Verrucomicrobiales bacterium]
MRDEAELLRRARLQIRFGWLGAIFGTMYASFYLAIGHPWGAIVIVICSFLFGQVPWMVKHGKSLPATGHLFSAVLVSGFGALCAIEGGLHGHAIAWMAAIPLCALLLVELKGALIWSMVCLLIVLGFGISGVKGVDSPKLYPVWSEALVSAAGYAGLVLFMSLLGLIFERTRIRAVLQTEEALDRLTDANLRLSRLNREKDEFMNIAAHDLKNPLCAISGHAQMLEIFGIDSRDKAVETALVIRRQTERMLDIISNLLDVRKIEEGRMSYKLGPCDAPAMMGEVVSDYRQRAEQKDIKLEVHCKKAAVATADSTAVRQILDNLVSNALKYSPPHTTIQCSVVPEPDAVTFEIVDQGPGLSDEDQKRLFRKFTRLTPTPTAGESSNGLGLWIVHRMAQGMHGEVFCRSKLGRGSCFGLRLPVASLPVLAA